jgi:hypothetical protein
VAPYLLATGGGIASPYVTLAICAAIATFYALPATTADIHRDGPGDRAADPSLS